MDSVKKEKAFQEFVEEQLAGMSWFVTPDGRKAVKAYYEVPVAIIEKARELRLWSLKAIGAASM